MFLEEMSFEGNIDIEINEIQKQITQLENRIIQLILKQIMKSQSYKNKMKVQIHK